MTTVREVRQIRGAALHEGRTVDGRNYFLRYADYGFYFTSDSVAEFARYFPTGMLRPELEELLGKPKAEQRQPNFQIEAIYSDTISALFDRAGQTVVLVEYRRRGQITAPSPGAAKPSFLEAYKLRLFIEVAMACAKKEGGTTLSLEEALGVVERHTVSVMDGLAAGLVKDSLKVIEADLCDAVVKRLVNTTAPY